MNAKHFLTRVYMARNIRFSLKGVCGSRQSQYRLGRIGAGFENACFVGSKKTGGNWINAETGEVIC